MADRALKAITIIVTQTGHWGLNVEKQKNKKTAAQRTRSMD